MIFQKIDSYDVYFMPFDSQSIFWVTVIKGRQTRT